MVRAALPDDAMAKKTAPKGKSEPDSKGETTMIRVTVEFAELVRDAAMLDRTSIAEFATEHFQPIAKKRYADAIKRAAKKLEDEP